MEEKSSNNVLNIYTALDNDNENNINESSGSDLNTNNRTPINLHVSLNKTMAHILNFLYSEPSYR